MAKRSPTVTLLKKHNELPIKVDSWYPSVAEVALTQREQVAKARQEAAAFASQKFGRPVSSWWRSLLGMR